MFLWLVRLMFLGIIALGFGMLYRAWAIGIRQDYRHVADWRGRAIEDAASKAHLVMGINGAAGGALLLDAILVLLLGLPLTVWTGVAAFLLWSYYFALRVLVMKDKRKNPVES